MGLGREWMDRMGLGGERVDRMGSRRRKDG